MRQRKYIGYEEIEVVRPALIICDVCGKEKKWDKEELPRGWYHECLIFEAGWILAGQTVVNHYKRFGDFCSAKHRDDWIALMKKEDDGQIKVGLLPKTATGA